MTARLALWLAACVLAGCAPELREGHFACGPAGECPDGWFCRDDRRCWSAPGSGGDDGGHDGGSDGGSDAGTDAGTDGGADACVPRSDSVDLLVVVDDSGTMREEQAMLAEAFPELVRALSTGDVEPDGVVDFPPVGDLHVGVVSTDMGTGGFLLPTCTLSDFGHDGVLQNTPNPSLPRGCAETYPAFLTYEPGGGGLSAFRDAFACIGTLGTGGCGFEQQLEAALKAVTPATSDIRFHDDTTGHGDGPNAGFLREDSIVVVLVVTDEEDCSVRDPELFNPSTTTYEGDLNLRCSQNPSALHPISRYADGLQALRLGAEARVVFAPLVGIPPDVVGGAYDDILGDERMEYRLNTEGTFLVPSCEAVGRGQAYPARRFVELAEELDLLGSSVALGSICDTEFTPFLTRLLATIQPLVEDGCDSP